MSESQSPTLAMGPNRFTKSRAVAENDRKSLSRSLGPGD